jgi:hypothetical protein
MSLGAPARSCRTELAPLEPQGPGTNIADFDYLPEQGLVVFPTFLDNRVLAYHVEGR